jgi:uracil-DNA glycosylase
MLYDPAQKEKNQEKKINEKVFDRLKKIKATLLSKKK